MTTFFSEMTLSKYIKQFLVVEIGKNGQKKAQKSPDIASGTIYESGAADQT